MLFLSSVPDPAVLFSGFQDANFTGKKVHYIVFNDNTLFRSHNIVEIRDFLHLLVDGRIRILIRIQVRIQIQIQIQIQI
jgi:hypothetical protein